MCNLWLASSILSPLSSIQPFANEVKKFLQPAWFSLLPLQNLCRKECTYAPLSLSQMVLWDDVRSLIISEVPHNGMIHEMMEYLLKSLETDGHLPLKLSECGCLVSLNQEMFRGLEAAWVRLIFMCPRLRQQYLGRLDCQTGFKSRKENKSSEQIFEIIVTLDIHISPLHSNTEKALCC